MPVVLHEATVGVNGDPGPWISHEADLSIFRGKTVTIEFGLTNSAPEIMALRLDDVRLEVTPLLPSYEVFLGTSPQLLSGDRVGLGLTPSVDLSGLKASTQYYWRVDQIVGGKRVASPVFSFTTTSSGLVAPPQLADFRVDGVTFRFALPTEAGHSYRVERLVDLSSNAWNSEAGPFMGDGTALSVEIPVGAAAAGLFRIVVDN